MQLRGSGGGGFIPFIPRTFEKASSKLKGNLTHNSIEEEKAEMGSSSNLLENERKNLSAVDPLDTNNRGLISENEMVEENQKKNDPNRQNPFRKSPRNNTEI